MNHPSPASFSRLRCLLLACLLACLPPTHGHAQTAGSLDLGFDPGAGTNAIVRSVALQPDGKVVIGGDFTTVNKVPRPGIARLNADGSLDTGFDVGVGPNVIAIYGVAVQPDGKVIVIGAFSRFDGMLRGSIVRLNADGSMDAGFALGEGGDFSPRSVFLQPDGKIVLGGGFDSFDGARRGGVARLNPDGSLDPSFTVGGSTTPIRTMALQPDGKIIVAGGFDTIGGVPRVSIARLSADGSTDVSFNPGTGPRLSGGDTRAFVNAVAVQPDGKVVVGGSFTIFNGVAQRYLVRLNADGSTDTGFNLGTGPNNSVDSLAVLSDGKILVGGGFISFNGVQRIRFARLNANGSVDAGFDPGDGANGLTGASTSVSAIAVQPDGKIIVAGGFDTFGKVPRVRIARLNVADVPPVIATPTVTVSVDTPAISRGAGQRAAITFARTGDLSQKIKVRYQVTGKLVGGSDYARLSGVQKIKAGRASGVLQIVPLASGTNGKAKVNVLPGAGYTLGSPTRVKVKIKN